MKTRSLPLASWLWRRAAAAMIAIVVLNVSCLFVFGASPEYAVVAPLPPGVDLGKLTALYTEDSAKTEQATAKLQSLAKAQPDLVKFPWLNVLAASAESLVPIAWAQALADPTLKPVVLDYLNNPIAFETMRERLARGPEGGLLNFPAAKTPAELAALITKAAPAYRHRFQVYANANMAKAPELPQEVSDSVISGWRTWFVNKYLMRHGYVFDAAQHAFSPVVGKLALEPVDQNYYYLKVTFGAE